MPSVGNPLPRVTRPQYSTAAPHPDLFVLFSRQVEQGVEEHGIELGYVRQLRMDVAERERSQVSFSGFKARDLRADRPALAGQLSNCLVPRVTFTALLKLTSNALPPPTAAAGARAAAVELLSGARGGTKTLYRVRDAGLRETPSICVLPPTLTDCAD